MEQITTNCFYSSIKSSALLDAIADSEAALSKVLPPGRKNNAHCYHVLYLIDQLTQMGGAERALLKMVAHLPSEKMRTSVITFRDNVHPLAKVALGDSLHILPLKRTFDGNAFRAAWWLRNFIRREKVDIVQTFFETSDIWGGAIAKISGVRALVSGRRDMSIRRSLKHRIAYRFLRNLYNRVVAVSDAVRVQAIQHEKLNPKKVITLHSGVSQAPLPSINSSHDLLDEHKIPYGASIVITVANVLPWKGHELFLQTCVLLHTEFPNAHFVIAGAFTDKQLLERLRHEVERHNFSERFHFLGSVDDVAGLLRQASVFCLLSDSEGFPNAVVEAMAAGLPVVATNVGGTGEAVQEGQTGFLVPPGNPALVADRVAQLLRSPELCEQFGRAGKTRFQENFTIEEMMRKWIKLYEDLMAE